MFGVTGGGSKEATQDDPKLKERAAKERVKERQELRKILGDRTGPFRKGPDLVSTTETFTTKVLVWQGAHCRPMSNIHPV